MSLSALKRAGDADRHQSKPSKHEALACRRSNIALASCRRAGSANSSRFRELSNGDWRRSLMVTVAASLMDTSWCTNRARRSSWISRRPSRGASRAALAFLVLLTGCGRSPSSPSDGLLGGWGGDHVSLTVGETSSHLEFDCAHADIPGALTVTHAGLLAAAGTFVREHGGPIRVGEPLDQHPALFTGTVSGDVMSLTIRLTDVDESLGPFTLARGASGPVFKCL
jgi:hypothetical protein